MDQWLLQGTHEAYRTNTQASSRQWNEMQPPDMQLGVTGNRLPGILDDTQSNQTNEEQSSSSIEHAVISHQNGGKIIHWNGLLL